jgi:hypothetical protein
MNGSLSRGVTKQRPFDETRLDDKMSPLVSHLKPPDAQRAENAVADCRSSYAIRIYGDAIFRMQSLTDLPPFASNRFQHGRFKKKLLVFEVKS